MEEEERVGREEREREICWPCERESGLVSENGAVCRSVQIIP